MLNTRFKTCATPAPPPSSAARPGEHERIDWSQLWYPGPCRVFSADELARAGTDRPSRTFLVMLLISVIVVSQMLLQRAPDGEVARLTGLLAGLFVAAYQAGLALWRQPSRRRLAWACGIANLLFLLIAVGVKWRVDDPAARAWLVNLSAGVVLSCCAGFWFVAVYRAEQIAGRLRELAEREQSLALARQLATAQIKPHFMFNTLASLQHWVDTRDERAGPLLASLTAYLRATLPLFEKRELTLAQELEAVRRYLEVMRARWGERLRHELHADADTLAAALPPGALLTLVENAVEHGAGANLGGGSVRVFARAVTGVPGGPLLQVDVQDDGPGLPAGDPPETGHLGLANTRMRLAQTFGQAARLSLTNRPEGGCLARLECPLRAPVPAAPLVSPDPAATA
ncbi:sensor histidine kinase [Ideonella sp.]|uniref:sensor histidine kinase n=1 Tax=Ideonella sp. TaxID=1929293 RepID=UPI0035B48F6B